MCNFKGQQMWVKVNIISESPDIDLSWGSHHLLTNAISGKLLATTSTREERRGKRLLSKGNTWCHIQNIPAPPTGHTKTVGR
jgi:hypothetical protein